MKLAKTYSVKVIEIEDKINNVEVQDTNIEDEVNKQIEEDRRSYDLTSIPECLNVAMHEYDLERNKKQSFDNRAGIIITVFAAIIIAIYDKISVAEIIAIMYKPLTFTMLIQIIVVCLIYLSLLMSLVFAINIISIKPYENFDIRIIDSEFISCAKIQSVSKILEIYLNLVRMHRKKNENIATKLACSQWSMIISIILIVVYLSMQ